MSVVLVTPLAGSSTGGGPRHLTCHDVRVGRGTQPPAASPYAPSRIVLISSASGSGKTTIGRQLARRLAVPFHELDAVVHGPGWTEMPDAELRRHVQRIVAEEGWVIDGSYQRKLGDLVLEHADVIAWLDLPIRVWLPRLARRTVRRARRREELWNGNRESLRHTLLGWDSLFVYALRSHFRRRRDYPARLAPYPVVRLRTAEDVERWLTFAGGRGTRRSTPPRATPATPASR